MDDEIPRYKGHIDPDCEVYRGVGAWCTCETPSEKAERLKEQQEAEQEADNRSNASAHTSAAHIKYLNDRVMLHEANLKLWQQRAEQSEAALTAKDQQIRDALDTAQKACQFDRDMAARFAEDRDATKHENRRLKTELDAKNKQHLEAARQFSTVNEELHVALDKAEAALTAKDQQIAQLEAWKDAIIDACVVDWIFTKDHESNPQKAVNDLLVWQQKIALDPAVSKEAHELHAEIARLREQVAFYRQEAINRELECNVALARLATLER